MDIRARREGSTGPSVPATLLVVSGLCFLFNSLEVSSRVAASPPPKNLNCRGHCRCSPAQLFHYSLCPRGLPGFEVGERAKVRGLRRVVQRLVAPPFLPRHDQVARGGPKIVAVTLEVVEKEMEIAPGVFVQALTFNGTNPGPLIVVHVDDYVELTLKNPSSNIMVHNIDFHASTGALGGGSLTQVGPGQEVKLRWKATKAGTFVYHCAPGGAMIPYHVVAGMNGAIMVLPREGLKDERGRPVRYDRAYYIGEQDFYIPKDASGNFKRYPNPNAALADTLEAAKTLIPTHITFNGKVGALTGETR